ncbi:bifunctional 3-(3-hydroxy-phenyl)propionate/3-hydroxycinnamic acid hydroxylase [Stakelama tenebrarum]|uniref:Bifunctional 3-(3-hydroxy-phenyl)propionate/3-hydroxycinnamic acid hydroxylase n=1 Tax=Stakelama tenebrarum TaxID=2711215 RepID=A0A6G6Y143_9SPHN|nr:bifunctional 3-(3-hydroxy-phenyl)propionate/3-hydroxycinnamic acid hydroxylase [Sphingosinithalassobacter tenebrarum]QIG78619.1 bifunctional 3-(3-hydroxy-phenyl)propionate/3-hydroxycinnamic acid hydroxylase [Sphingosinithalassobacter tenebrarum]
MPDYDIIQVGYGPVSEALALMLGRQGRRVAVCERWRERYPLPRAVCIDHELYRVLQAIGLENALPRVTQPGPVYQWFNADWKELLAIDWSKPSISGGVEVNFVHQPTLEQALDDAVRQQSSVDLYLGCEVITVEQGESGVVVTLREDGVDERQLSAKYVIGCDGANSLVRSTIGSGQEDRGFEADWLVIDVRLKSGVTIEELGIPAAGQYCNPERPTTIVPAGISGDRIYRRWEFMRLPGESAQELESEAKVWELLSPWAGPAQVELIRHKIYNFRSLMADKWRDGRLLIAGDAAHVMPPFMGQGMCAGLRDGWNLAWKLGLVLDGRADDRLLDSYQTERQPHVRQLTNLSIYLGKMICVPDADAAAERDRAFFEGTAPPPPDFPHLTDGLLYRPDGDALQPGAGLLSPHVTLEHEGRTMRLDAFDGGGGFLLFTREIDPATAMDALSCLPLRAVRLGQGDGTVRDLDGRIDDFLDEHGWAGMIVRPDFYVYGGAADAAAFDRLALALADDLAAAGVRLFDLTTTEIS